MTWSMRSADARTHHPAHGRDQRRVPGRAQPGRVERRDSPVLPGGVEVVGGRTDPRVRSDHVLPEPGVGAVRSEPDCEIVHQRDSRPARASWVSSDHCSQRWKSTRGRSLLTSARTAGPSARR